MNGRWLLSVLLASSQLAAQTSASETTEERFVAGLVARRLFTLAEMACHRRLTDPELSRREQVSWTVELIRITGQCAAHSSATQRAARWKAAHQAVESFLTAHPEHPRRILVELQDALTYLAEGELARLESDVANEPQEALDRSARRYALLHADSNP